MRVGVISRTVTVANSVVRDDGFLVLPLEYSHYDIPISE